MFSMCVKIFLILQKREIYTLDDANRDEMCLTLILSVVGVLTMGITRNVVDFTDATLSNSPEVRSKRLYG